MRLFGQKLGSRKGSMKGKIGDAESVSSMEGTPIGKETNLVDSRGGTRKLWVKKKVWLKDGYSSWREVEHNSRTDSALTGLLRLKPLLV